MHRGRTPSKHWTVEIVDLPDGGFMRLKKLTPAGIRRRRRRHAILEATTTLTFVGTPLREAFQEAVRTLGPRPADRKWAWERLRKQQEMEA